MRRAGAVVGNPTVETVEDVNRDRAGEWTRETVLIIPPPVSTRTSMLKKLFKNRKLGIVDVVIGVGAAANLLAIAAIMFFYLFGR